MKDVRFLNKDKKSINIYFKIWVIGGGAQPLIGGAKSSLPP